MLRTVLPKRAFRSSSHESVVEFPEQIVREVDTDEQVGVDTVAARGGSDDGRFRTPTVAGEAARTAIGRARLHQGCLCVGSNDCRGSLSLKKSR
ncbi:hypothetical protein ACFQL0_15855 [Haloplanus litoreus]|uniref:hypothetical protein n=1 Tax=Haloplanus litoreus TaxID=767515 RepID=UPI00361B3E4A